jgi:hypothetical protein
VLSVWIARERVVRRHVTSIFGTEQPREAQTRPPCCNKADCYPTEIRMLGGSIFARRREDGKFIPVPPQKIEQNRDNPDGRNHLCAPPPTATGYPPDTVFCFALGGGI